MRRRISSPLLAGLALALCIVCRCAAESGEAGSPTAARLLYRRAPRWDDWARLVAAVELPAALTALHVVSAETCAKAPAACAGGSPAVAGDAAGRLTLVSPSDGVLLEIPGPSTAAVTAIASFPGVKKGLVVLAGRGDGSLTWHRLAEPQGGGAPGVEAWGFIPTAATSAWSQLAASPWAGGRHGAANIGGITAGGAVAWGRIKLEEAADGDVGAGEDEAAAAAGAGGSITRRKKPGKKKKAVRGRGAELHWDAAFGGGADAALTATPHRAAVQVVTAGGEVAWGALIAKPGYALRPPFPCTGWARHGTAGLSAAALTASVPEGDGPAPRHFAAAWGGRLLALHTSPTPGAQVCHVTGASPPLVADETALAGGGGAAVASLAALPGYVLAVTSEGRLAVVNVTGPFLRPSMAVVLQTPLQSLAAEVAAASGAAAAASWWPWKRGAPASSPLQAVPRPLVAAAGSPAVAAAPGATGVVAIQVGPSSLALYATALPHRPLPRQKPSVRGNWAGALQPIIIAVAVGSVFFRQRAQRRQKEAFFAMVQSRAQEARGGGLGDGPRRGRLVAGQEPRERRGGGATRARARRAAGGTEGGDFSGDGAGSSADEGGDEYRRWLADMSSLGAEEGDGSGVEAAEAMPGGGAFGAATQPFPWEQRDADRRARVAARFDAIEAEYVGGGSSGGGGGGGDGGSGGTPARRELSARGMGQRASRAAAASRRVPASPPPLIDRAPMPGERSSPLPGLAGAGPAFSDTSI